MNFNEDGILLNIKTKKGKDSPFSISGSTEGTPTPLKEELLVQAKLLKNSS